MKLYVLPVEERCDGKCFFCITKRRNVAKEDSLDIQTLEQRLGEVKGIDKIEITGGGEATLHADIDKVIEICAKRSPTIMYTHGKHLAKVNNLDKLSELCISLAHYDPIFNLSIMGVNPDFEAARKAEVPIKFSLILNKKGIYNEADVRRYLDFVKSKGASRVVIRQIFEETKGLEKFFVSTQEMANRLSSYKVNETTQGNPIIFYNGLHAELEYRSCACEMDNLVLHADGKIVKGWDYK